MTWMNEYEIEDAARKHANHPILGPATETMLNLMRWTNSNSDGWPYWNPPAKASEKLMQLIDRPQFRYEVDRTDVSEADYKAALRPIKSFRTRKEADFVIVEEFVPPILRVRCIKRTFHGGVSYETYADWADWAIQDDVTAYEIAEMMLLEHPKPHPDNYDPAMPEAFAEYEIVDVQAFRAQMAAAQVTA